jgi:glycosyltransferase involved in cell wall biosynthesis
MVSRMTSEDRYKGHEHVIRAWRAVRAQVPDAALVLVGDGDDCPRLERIASEQGVDGSIRFVGGIGDKDVEEWFRKCTFFVLPSDREGFGLVFLEAMRAGKACICAPGAPAEVVVNDVTGLVVPPRDEDALAAAMIRLFLDRELRTRLGRNGHARFMQMFTSRHFAVRLRRLVAGAVAPEHAA